MCFTVATKAIHRVRFFVHFHAWCFVIVEGTVDVLILVYYDSVMGQNIFYV